MLAMRPNNTQSSVAKFGASAVDELLDLDDLQWRRVDQRLGSGVGKLVKKMTYEMWFPCILGFRNQVMWTLYSGTVQKSFISQSWVVRIDVSRPIK